MEIVDRPLRVMISSRCTSVLKTEANGTATMSEVRLLAKAAVERLLPYGNVTSAYDVWINEPVEAVGGDNSWFEESIEQARRADIVIVLYSGDPGSKLPGGSRGVCHAEFLAARADAPTKVRVVDVRAALADVAPTRSAGRRQQGGVAQQARDDFAADVDRLALIMARPQHADEVGTCVSAAVAAATHQLALQGVVAARRGAKSLGAALDWRRLDFATRKRAMEASARRELDRRLRDEALSDERLALVAAAGSRVLVRITGAPEGLAVAASREMVGQPHHLDHDFVGAMDATHAEGPVHLIVSAGSVTAAQARALFGRADLLVARLPGGIWVADRFTRAQALLIGNCEDASATELRVDEAPQWLSSSGEDAQLAVRAAKRAVIVRAMAGPDHFA